MGQTSQPAPHTASPVCHWPQEGEGGRLEGQAPRHRQPSAPGAGPHWPRGPPQTAGDRRPTPCLSAPSGPTTSRGVQDTRGHSTGPGTGRTPCVLCCSVLLSATPGLLGQGAWGRLSAQLGPHPAPARPDRVVSGLPCLPETPPGKPGSSQPHSRAGAGVHVPSRPPACFCRAPSAPGGRMVEGQTGWALRAPRPS